MPIRSRLSSFRNPKTREHVLELRANMTREERRLWYFLRRGFLVDLRFRHQVPIGPYIVDFLCEPRRLVIEVDGGQHDERRRRDEVRSAWLATRGYRVIRFWNDEVVKNMEGVAAAILESLGEQRGSATPSPALPQGGGRTAPRMQRRR